MTLKILVNIFLLGFLLVSCNNKIIENVKTETNTTPDINAINEPKELSQELVLSNRGIIWGFDFLPNSSIIFTEKSGKISIFSNNIISKIKGLPADVDASGQGGMLDVCIHPDYKTNGWIYAC